MSLLDLKNKLFCNRKVGESNFTAAKALSILQSQFNLPKIPSFDSIRAKITGIAEGYAKSAEDLVMDAKASLIAEFDALGREFDNIKTQLTNIKDQVGVLVSSCPEAINNNPSSPTVNTVSDTLSTPSTNDDASIQISTDTKIKKDTENSKSQGINKTSDNITTINNKSSTMGVLEARTYVKQFSNPHPILNNYVSQLSLFKPISQTVGESYFGFTIDKPSLQLSYWETARCIRTATRYKMRDEIAQEIQTNYAKLNKAFVSNISNEFFTERRSAPFNTSHAYHIAGDSLFFENHMSSTSILKKALAIILGTTLGDQANLINYLVPIFEKIKIQNDLYTVKTESNMAIINKRNDIVRKSFTNVNNSVLKPKALTEE